MPINIPPELVGEIVNSFDLSEEYDFEVADALKSCALIARSFVRPCQTRLFAVVSFRHYENTGRRDALPSPRHISSTILSRRLLALLSGSPHIAPYIRTLDLCYNSNAAEAEFVPRILSTLRALHTLVLTDHFNPDETLKPSAFDVFSLPRLRRVELCQYKLHNVSDLDSLLSQAKGLKELTVRGIRFNRYRSRNQVNMGIPRELRRKSTVRTQVEDLTLVELDMFALKSVLECCYTVDIEHLKSLSIIDGRPATGFSRAKSHSAPKLKIGRSSSTTTWPCDVPGLGMIPGDHYLNGINFEVNELGSILKLVPLLGDLRNLTAWEIMEITLHHTLNAREMDKWEQLDGLLEPLPSAIQVHICVAFDFQAQGIHPRDVEAIKARLPVLSNRRTLHVHHNPAATPAMWCNHPMQLNTSFANATEESSTS
ncbi:hypothetical protein C8R45DRAFT_946317 [Mycena sanguinolenta]|nr:hypothetical protein C8R45DRAFT_946317 [Mycena sanguinolenta]